MQPESAAIVITPAEALPSPRFELSVRLATKDDLPFIDLLQKAHTHQVGFFPRQQVLGYIDQGGALIAEDEQGSPVGYCIFRDSYSGRDDVGQIYQINVASPRQRKLVGASLVKGAFERAAYGVKLFGAWCAQDIQANWFWESIGFVPLAFRTGTRSKERTHIYWQKRIREGDISTPWWFPHLTKSGAFREDRIAFPIPEGVHWRDPMPIVLPEAQQVQEEAPATLPGGRPVRGRPQQSKLTVHQQAALARLKSKHHGAAPVGKVAVLTGSGIKYVNRPGFVAETDTSEELAGILKVKQRKARTPAPKHDPKHIAMARELRDRFLDHVNSDPALLLPAGKYAVARQLPAPAMPIVQVRALPEAA